MLKRSSFHQALFWRPFGLTCDQGLMSRFLEQDLQTLQQKTLYGHYRCVNALEFSRDGRLMASGGDDLRLLVWPVWKCLEQKVQPTDAAIMQSTHLSNIFCLDFDCFSERLLSGGNDVQVRLHDVASGAFVDNFLHEEAVYGLSAHPSSPSLFSTACADGKVYIYDIRMANRPDSEPVTLASSVHSFHSVAFNPVEPRLLVTANLREGVALYDLRRPKTCLLKYGLALDCLTAMSVSFNSSGSRILALGRQLSPMVFALESPCKLFELDHPGYFNSCTMKSGCFGGFNDHLVLSGSDDNSLYVWDMPEQDCAYQMAKRSKSSEDAAEEVVVKRARMVLHGHRSIVNQVRYNSALHFFASSGVEKIIKLWSPFTLPDERGGRQQASSDKVPTSGARSSSALHSSHQEEANGGRGGDEDDDDDGDDDDDDDLSDDVNDDCYKENEGMIVFFRSLVRRDVLGDSSSASSLSEENESSSNDSSSPFVGRAASEEGHQDSILELIMQKRRHIKRKRSLLKSHLNPYIPSQLRQSIMTANRLLQAPSPLPKDSAASLFSASSASSVHNSQCDEEDSDETFPMGDDAVALGTIQSSSSSSSYSSTSDKVCFLRSQEDSSSSSESSSSESQDAEDWGRGPVDGGALLRRRDLAAGHRSSSSSSSDSEDGHEDEGPSGVASSSNLCQNGSAGAVPQFRVMKGGTRGRNYRRPKGDGDET